MKVEPGRPGRIHEIKEHVEQNWALHDWRRIERPAGKPCAVGP